MKAILLLPLVLLSLGAQAQTRRPKAPAPSQAQVYDSVAQPAIPLGGTAAYARFLAENQRYPGNALLKGLQGTVPVSFVVEKTGSISNVKVDKPLAPELDAEALRLIKSGPRWTPARHFNQVVRQRVVVPVSFALSPSRTVAAPPAAGGLPAAPAGAGSMPQAIAPDVPAHPVGGEEAFFEWIQKNQRYPGLAVQRKIQGRVMVEFMVQPDGQLTDVRVLKKLGSGLDEEALRLIRSAPRWEPATYKGKPLKQKLVLPVIFQL